MIQRKRGKMICVASRSGTVDFPRTLAYSVCKSAVIRAVGCIQAELDIEGLGEYIDLYALHSGGVFD